MNRLKKHLPSRRWLFLPPVLLGVIVVTILVTSKRELARRAPDEAATPVNVISVSRIPLYPQITGYGTAQPGRRWLAVAEVGGRIDETHRNLKSGIPVSQGEVLVSIDPTDYELKLQQCEADQSQSESQLEQLRLNQAADRESLSIQSDLLEVRNDDFERLKSLQNRSAASNSELDSVHAALLQQKQSVQSLVNALSLYPAKLESAEAAISISKAKTREAERNLSRTRISSPFAGVLANVDLEAGQYVAPGQTLFEVIDTGWVEVEAHVSMAQWSRIVSSCNDAESAVTADLNHESASGSTPAAPTLLPPNRPLGLSATVRARIGDGQQEFRGTPIRFASSIDERTRTLGIIVRVDNPPGSIGGRGQRRPRLRPGTYCEVTLKSDQPILAFEIPRPAIEDGTVLYVDADSRLQRKLVRIAFPTEGHYAVTEGLSEGDQVATSPPSNTLDGLSVTPILSTAIAEKPVPDSDGT